MVDKVHVRRRILLNPQGGNEGSSAMYLSWHTLEEIRNHAREELPNEACGYLIGDSSRAYAVYKMTNADHSPVHFSFDPIEQFEALHTAREMGKELIAVYHSHPETPARMSGEDIRKANDTKIVYLVYAAGVDEIKGFTVTREKTVTEVPVEMVPFNEEECATH